MTLTEPMEYLDLLDGQSLTFHVLDYELGEAHITNKTQGVTKTIRALRVTVDPGEKPHFPYYYDLSSKNVIAQLEPLLPAIKANKRAVTITKHGVAPVARFTVEIR